MTKYLDLLPTQLLDYLEFAVESCGLSRRQALIELGIPEEKVNDLILEREDEEHRRTSKNIR